MNIISSDKKNIWHPYTQHALNPTCIPIVKAKGAYVYDDKGDRYIDSFSSWWTCLHGHSHPYIAKKIAAQAKKLEHVIFAGFTHQPAVELADRLLKKLPKNQKKIFFSDNGSTAVEVALKMCFQFWYNTGKPKTKVIAFKNAYHGDTFGAMAVGERSAFSAPFDFGLFETFFIDPPIKGKEEQSIRQLRAIIKNEEDKIAAFIFEPIVQGVAGMLLHEAKALDEMILLCQQNNIFTIADEVFTGFGRTGKFFASDYLSRHPDIFCLSKGLTGGTLAMGVTSCKEEIFNAFLSEDRMKTFFHGHSFTANPIACATALASLDLMEKKETQKNIQRIAKRNLLFQARIKNNSALVSRTLGTILALEIKLGDTSYFNNIRDAATTFFLQKKILLRPLGNVIYILPPYCISDKDLDYIYDSILEFVHSLNGTAE